MFYITWSRCTEKGNDPWNERITDFCFQVQLPCLNVRTETMGMWGSAFSFLSWLISTGWTLSLTGIAPQSRSGMMTISVSALKELVHWSGSYLGTETHQFSTDEHEHEGCLISSRHVLRHSRINGVLHRHLLSRLLMFSLWPQQLGWGLVVELR